MAFDITYLQPLGGQGRRGRASQTWSYWTTDAHTTVDGSGYMNGGVAFSGAYSLLERGDVVNVVVWSGAIGDAGAVSTYGPHIVLDKSTTTGSMDLSNVTTGTVTDSD